jgi:predicted transcriptional regulator
MFCAGCSTELMKGKKKTRCVACSQFFCADCLPTEDRPVKACDPCLKKAIESMKERERADVVKALKRLERIKKLKDELAAKRDELRKEIDDVTDICESIDRGVEDIDSGLRELQRGLDACSELI